MKRLKVGCPIGECLPPRGIAMTFRGGWISGGHHGRDRGEDGYPLSVMAGRVPANDPQPVGAALALYNRRCAGGRDTPGHDGEMEVRLP